MAFVEALVALSYTWSQITVSIIIYDSSSTISRHLSIADSKFQFQAVPPSIIERPPKSLWGKMNGIDDEAITASIRLSLVEFFSVYTMYSPLPTSTDAMLTLLWTPSGNYEKISIIWSTKGALLKIPFSKRSPPTIPVSQFLKT